MSLVGGVRVEVAGAELLLLPQRAAFWGARSTLLIADLHVGKAAAFRAGGVPIPRGTTEADLARLSEVLRTAKAERLVVLGDLYHAKAGMWGETLERLANWRQAWQELTVEVVLGNHDRRAGPSPADLGFIEYQDPLIDPPFVLRHHPIENPAGYVLAGHIHPAARLRGRGLRSLRLPCFHFGPSTAVLPAFGTFTGNALIRPKRGDGVFVVTETEVVGVGVRGSSDRRIVGS